MGYSKILICIARPGDEARIYTIDPGVSRCMVALTVYQVYQHPASRPSVLYTDQPQGLYVANVITIEALWKRRTKVRAQSKCGPGLAQVVVLATSQYALCTFRGR